MAPDSNDRTGHKTAKDPIAALDMEHAHLLSLCDRLEEIADALPNNLDPYVFETVARELRTMLPRLHRHMQQLLFPLLKKRARQKDGMADIIAGFTHEQNMDAGYALGVLDILDRFASGQLPLDHEPKDYEAVGYLLRGFFESLRRHLRWERFLVLRLARRRLNKEDLAQLQLQISKDVV